MEKENNLEKYLGVLDFKERTELQEMFGYKMMELESYDGNVPENTRIQIFKDSYEIGKKLKPRDYEEFIEFVSQIMDDVDKEENHDYGGRFEKKVLDRVKSYKPRVLDYN